MSIEKTWTLLLVAFAALLPFGPALPNILAGIILAFAFLQIVRGQFKLGKKNIIHFVWMNAYVLFLAFSIGWSENQIYGWNKLLLLLFIPLFFLALISSRAYINTRLFVKSIEVFVISNCILLVLSFISAIAKNGLSITGLTQNDLSTALIDFHFLGFSLYSAIGLLLGLFIYFDKQHKMTEIIRKIWPLCLIVLSGGLFLLSSRTTLIMTAIGIVAILLFQRRQIKKKVRISVWLLLVLGSILFIAINPVLQEKIKDAINYEGQYDVKGYWGGRGFRELIWDCAWHQIQDHPFIGTGLGDQQEDMELCYRKHRYEQLLFQGNTFNAHNLFFQITIASGLIGLVLFLLAFAYPTYLSIRNENWLYIYFIFLLLGTGLTESHFNRNAIISLFALFNPLLFILALIPKHENTSDT